MESLRQKTKDVITPATFEAESQKLKSLIWKGEYREALPLADKILQFRTSRGEKEPALIEHASNYYSAASRYWKERGMKAATEVGRCMNAALRALQERVEIEIAKQGGRKEGMTPVSFSNLNSSELDVMQTVYRRAGEMADRIPLVRPLRQLLLSKERDPIRDFDAAALLAIRAGLKKVKEKADGKKVAPETEIFLQIGLFDIARRYARMKTADVRAARIFELAQQYPWPPEPNSAAEASQKLSAFGQAARVARHVRDVALSVQDDTIARKFEAMAASYAHYVPDQKAKL